MSRERAISGFLAMLCHAALLFGFRIGGQPVPLPVSDTAVEVSLVANAAPEPLPAPEPPPPEQISPPEPPPPKTDPLPEPTREPAPQITPKPEPHPEPSKPRVRTAPANVTPAGTANPTAPSKATPTTGARPRFNPKPAYPAEARQLRQQGRVILAVQVSADGRAASVSLARSSGFPLLDAAAVEGVRRWTFVPAQAAGLATPSRVEVPVVFALSQ